MDDNMKSVLTDLSSELATNKDYPSTSELSEPPELNPISVEDDADSLTSVDEDYDSDSTNSSEEDMAPRTCWGVLVGLRQVLVGEYLSDSDKYLPTGVGASTSIWILPLSWQVGKYLLKTQVPSLNDQYVLAMWDGMYWALGQYVLGIGTVCTGHWDSTYWALGQYVLGIAPVSTDQDQYVLAAWATRQPEHASLFSSGAHPQVLASSTCVLAPLRGEYKYDPIDTHEHSQLNCEDYNSDSTDSSESSEEDIPLSSYQRSPINAHEHSTSAKNKELGNSTRQNKRELTEDVNVIKRDFFPNITTKTKEKKTQRRAAREFFKQFGGPKPSKEPIHTRNPTEAEISNAYKIVNDPKQFRLYSYGHVHIFDMRVQQFLLIPSPSL
ncbi:hypothetical protein PSTG_07645 [Puccinia striiformis f. sp. tritici PST-78]|uniref:Uncharacterized protein n=1 Tax=Puccinia striiformis f. sp. tritici PST-78 TaxID=1165861 RepID=A0A0L0VJ54_9BASI|nr:hypothetical protein PSTG_07645 [Puccinia striiformis f. sp. tritici PST-78]